MKTRTVQLDDANVSRTNSIALGEIMPAKSGSVDPADFPNEVFDLYSIPAFDKGQPEVLTGREIGSTKQVIQPGDVLLSKIVPHIRRAWVVGRDRGRRLIASSEWIVFRSNKAHPDYLRHVLVGDQFQVRFMQTVSGVGGSLLRARPGYVAEIEIPLPPLSEQQRIAGVLEQADRLRRTRRYALELSDSFLPAAFRQLFGDGSTNPHRWPEDELGNLCSEVLDCPHSTPTYATGRPAHPCVRSSDIQNGYLDLSDAKCVTPSDFEKRIARGKPKRGDVIYCREGARFGNAARVIDDTALCLGQRMMLFRANPFLATSEYIWGFLSSASAYRQATRALDGSASPHVNVGEIVAFLLCVPPLALQQQFASLVSRHERLRAVQRESLRQAEHLFQSLLHRAFTT